MNVDISPYRTGDESGINIEAKVECTGPTGVEMEALTAVMGAALTVIDMVKAVDKAASIDNVKVVHKCGGKVFLAHLYQYDIEDNKHLDFAKNLFKFTNIDGMECYYPTFTEDYSSLSKELKKRGKTIRILYKQAISGFYGQHMIVRRHHPCLIRKGTTPKLSAHGQLSSGRDNGRSTGRRSHLPRSPLW